MNAVRNMNSAELSRILLLASSGRKP